MCDSSQFWDSIDYHSIFISLLVNGALKFFKLIIQVLNNLRVSEWCLNFHFWLNYSFNDTFSVHTYIFSINNATFD